MLEGNRSEARLELRLMDAEVAAESPIPDMTFRDIRRKVEAIAPLS
jgi:hypothetical protein